MIQHPFLVVFRLRTLDAMSGARIDVILRPRLLLLLLLRFWVGLLRTVHTLVLDIHVIPIKRLLQRA